MTVLGEILVEHGKEIGKEIGIAEGRTQGIEAFILDNLEENIPRGRIIDKLIRRFSLSRRMRSDVTAAFWTTPFFKMKM